MQFTNNTQDTPIHGIGVGLRQQHYANFLQDDRPDVAWLEVLSDNYIFSHGLLRNKLLKIREHYPMVLHGVGMNLGSVDPLNQHYLRALKTLADQIDAAWISDHLCWTAVNGVHSHELLPLPFTHEAVKTVVEHVQQAQDYLQRPLLIENVSTYWQPEYANYSEPEFINEIVAKTGCSILLDVNNVYVCAQNHGFSAENYLQTINKKAVKQFHLAGYITHDNLLIDTHSTAVSEPVWQLYRKALHIFGSIPTNIEWDNDVPEWSSIEEQLQLTRAIYDETR
jgi:uncharacterized protein (UPF0276 family)